MKTLIITGLIFLIISVGLFWFEFGFSFDRLFAEFPFWVGTLFGMGLGQFIGGLVGYISKGSAMKEAEIKKQLAQLKKEKEILQQNQNNDTTSLPS